MKLHIERDAAVKALGRVQGVVKPKGTIPILTHVKLESGATTLCLTTGNGDQQASASAPANVARPGSIAVEARRLFDIVRAFPSGGEIRMELTEGDPRLTVHCGRSRCLLATLPAEDFPQYPSLENAAGGVIDSADLKRLLMRTRFATSSDEVTRPVWSGVFLHVADRDGAPWLTAVGLDGKVMGIAEIPAPAGFESFPPIILPGSAVDEIQRMLGDAESTVELLASDTLAEVRSGHSDFTTKLVDGPYSEYRNALPADNPVVVPLDVDLLQACINRALLVSDDKYRTVRFGLAPDRLTISSRAEAGDQITDDIEIAYAGPAADLGFNAKRVKDLLAVITGENAICAFSANPKDGAVLVTDSADPDCRFVLTQQK